MRPIHLADPRGPRVAALTVAVALAGFSAGSQAANPGSGTTATDPSRMTRAGFLTDYARLKPDPETGVHCWRATDVDLKRFEKMMIPRIVVSLKTDPKKAIDPADLKAVVDYFHNSMETAVKEQMPIADQPGPGVLVMKIALTGLVPTDTARSVMGTLVPFGFVAEGGSGVATGRPVGSTPYLGETGVEVQFTNGADGAIIAECADTQIGRKYAAELDKGAGGAARTWASGYTGSFKAWAYAKDAFDKWSALVARRLAALRAAS